MDKGPAEKKVQEADPLTDAQYQLWRRLDVALAEDGFTASDVQMITHIRRWGIGKTEDEKFETAFEKLKIMLEIRRKYDLDNILEKPWQFKDISFEDCSKLWPLFYFKRTKEGWPILYDGLGASDPKECKKVAKHPQRDEMIMDYILRNYENFARIKERISKERGCRIYKEVMIFDMSRVSLTGLKRVKGIVKEAMR